MLYLVVRWKDYDDGQMKGSEGYSILDFLKILKLLKSKEKQEEEGRKEDTLIFFPD